MSSDQSFVDYVCEQAALGKALTYRKMFGEYALYLGEKVVALVCDNSWFLKPTDAGRAVVGKVVERALKVTADALPAPKLKVGAISATRGKKSGSATKKKTKPRN
jgi:TfoX/Sxy family transcriptional regulator of competence genes